MSGVRDTPSELMKLDVEGSRLEVPVHVLQDQDQDGDNQNAFAKASYACMVRNSESGVENTQDWLDIDPNRIVVLDEDCVVNRNGKSPTIKFSERVHAQIDLNMKTVVIFKLLGRNIGYRTLLNQIHVVWKPWELQLIELDGNYFLVWKRLIHGAVPSLCRKSIRLSPPGVGLNVAYRASNPNKKSNSARAVAGKAIVVPMVDDNPTSLLEHHPTDKKVAHAAVTIMEQGHGRLILSEWVDNVTSQLNVIAAHAYLDSGNSIKAVVGHNGSLENVPPDIVRDNARSIEGVYVTSSHDQPMAFDQ
ncbi:hypothetical protein V6N11_018238 [Hibiscus sabdariffa]|uniref:Uncharacterized protein n=1 Tax=Hibiscus sabdariffa TaxID=183260 RepID=A0ABR2T7A2_9ROSI